MKTQTRYLPLLLAACLILAGCGVTAKSRFYFLSPIPDAEEGKAAGGVPELTVGIGPVSFPDYLDRPQIIVRSGENRMTFSDFEKWAEPLDRNFSRVLGENLSLILGTDRIGFYPFRNLPRPDYQVLVEVNRLDASPGEAAVLKLGWTLLKGKEKEVVLMRRSSFREALKDDEVATMVAAQSRMVARFSREVGEAILADSGRR